MRGIIEEGGRKLLVEFTCGRCGAVTHMPYEHNRDYDARCNMRATTLPDGWHSPMGMVPLLCDACAIALEEFLAKGGDTHDRD